MGSNPAVAEVQVELAERPDDDPLLCAFEPLSEDDVTQRLTALANPERTVFDVARGHLADTVAFQPCLRYSSQDRFVAQQLDVHGQKWTFTGVFDGVLLWRHENWRASADKLDFLVTKATSVTPPYSTPHITFQLL
jgi:pyruvate dehydrogenase phosphatase